MKLFLILLLVTAGAYLGWRALHAPELEYLPIEIVEPEATPSRVTGEVPAGFVLLEYDVQGMHCGGCSTRLYDALSELDLVEAAGVDHLLGRAQVVWPEGAGDAEVFAVFEAEEFPAQRLGGGS